MSNHQYDAWCSQHQTHPTNCFDIHNPTASDGRDIYKEMEEKDAIDKGEA